MPYRGAPNCKIRTGGGYVPLTVSREIPSRTDAQNQEVHHRFPSFVRYKHRGLLLRSDEWLACIQSTSEVLPPLVRLIPNA